MFRQADPTFVSILNEIRVGFLSDRARRVLESRLATSFENRDQTTSEKGEKSGDIEDEKIEPTRLYSHRRSVEEENRKCIDALHGESVCFHLHPLLLPHMLLTSFITQSVSLKQLTMEQTLF